MGLHYVDFTFAFDATLIQLEMTEIWPKFVAQAFLSPPPLDSVNGLNGSADAMQRFQSFGSMLWFNVVVQCPVSRLNGSIPRFYMGTVLKYDI